MFFFANLVHCLEETNFHVIVKKVLITGWFFELRFLCARKKEVSRICRFFVPYLLMWVRVRGIAFLWPNQGVGKFETEIKREGDTMRASERKRQSKCKNERETGGRNTRDQFGVQRSWMWPVFPRRHGLLNRPRDLKMDDFSGAAISWWIFPRKIRGKTYRCFRSLLLTPSQLPIQFFFVSLKLDYLHLIKTSIRNYFEMYFWFYNLFKQFDNLLYHWKLKFRNTI